MLPFSYKQSVHNIIGRAMLLILLLSALLAVTSLTTLSFSIRDAESVNVAGSLRMQSYRLAFALDAEPLQLGNYIAQFEHSLFDSSLTELNNWYTPDIISGKYNLVVTQWKKLSPVLLTDKIQYQQQVKLFVSTIDGFVKEIELYSKNKVWLLTLVQAVGFSLILTLGYYTVRYTKHEVVTPLLQLVDATKKIQQGHFEPKLPLSSKNELGILGEQVAHMANELGKLYRHLEGKVVQQTEQLREANQTLAFLHKNTQMLQVPSLDKAHIEEALTRLLHQLNLSQVSLHLTDAHLPIKDIHIGEQHTNQLDIINQLQLADVGFLKLCSHQAIDLNAAKSFATVLSKALDHNKAILQQQKLLLVEERSTIARELHDSLAQALSYLKIQVTVLKRALHSKEDDKIDVITDELQQGLNNAYQQLRELLSTFRLTVKETNLEKSLSMMVEELQTQTSANIQFKYELDHPSLPANRQIHILQIIREAALNAIKHASGSVIIISCSYVDNDQIQIAVSDNGIGLTGQAPLNHYGLNIMAERAEKLHGQLAIKPNLPSGTLVTLTFPQITRIS